MMQQMYSTKLFSQFYDNAEDFVADYKTCGIPAKISDESATTLFYLLYARYGNNPISNYDETQFKLKLFGLIFSAGPTWEKRIEIQDRLRGLNEAELLQGSKRILNTALNPETTPSTLGLEELTYINQQNTSNAKKSVLGAYAELWEVLKVDATSEFLDKFKALFRKVLVPAEYIYVTEDEE